MWKQTGWDVSKAFMFDRVIYQNYKHLRIGIGDGGFQSEVSKYASFCHQPTLWAASQYRQLTGRDISPYPDATHFNVRHMMTEWYGQDGTRVAIPINGHAGLIPGHVDSTFAICPEEWKPALLWAWNHAANIKEGDESTYINAVKTSGGFMDNPQLAMIQAFVNYPLDMKPVHPGSVMPKTWQAPTRGLYVLRSGWEGKDEFISQVFLKQLPIGGNQLPNAGNFTIWGLQKKWIFGADGKRDIRQMLPLVDLPDNPGDGTGNLWGYGKLANLLTEDDGSGTITGDLNEVYGRSKEVQREVEPEATPTKTSARLMTARQLRDKMKKEAKPAAYRPAFVDANFIRTNAEFDPEGPKGLRAFAFDYSGKAGVPCSQSSLTTSKAGIARSGAPGRLRLSERARRRPYPLPTTGSASSVLTRHRCVRRSSPRRERRVTSARLRSICPSRRKLSWKRRPRRSPWRAQLARKAISSWL